MTLPALVNPVKIETEHIEQLKRRNVQLSIIAAAKSQEATKAQQESTEARRTQVDAETALDRAFGMWKRGDEISQEEFNRLMKGVL